MEGTAATHGPPLSMYSHVNCRCVMQPIRNVKYQIQVARPFVYSFHEINTDRATERRFDIGRHEIDGPMMMDPWIHKDFADGRISHINGVPVHAPQDYGHVADHAVAARKAREQTVYVGGNRPAPPKREPKITVEVWPTRPAEEAGSLNLVGGINVIDDQPTGD
jgi:hypothetical protein